MVPSRPRRRPQSRSNGGSSSIGYCRKFFVQVDSEAGTLRYVQHALFQLRRPGENLARGIVRLPPLLDGAAGDEAELLRLRPALVADAVLIPCSIACLRAS